VDAPDLVVPDRAAGDEVEFPAADLRDAARAPQARLALGQFALDAPAVGDVDQRAGEADGGAVGRPEPCAV